MADPVVRQMIFYWRDKKAITANKVSVAIKVGREPLWGQEGILAWSKGHAVMTITASGFTPVGGSFTTDDIEKVLNNDDVPVSFVLGGKFYRIDNGAVTDLKYDSDSEKGTVMEEVTITCRRPNIVG